jgi:hypothetical protein
MVDVEVSTMAIEVWIWVRLATTAPDEDPAADEAKVLRHGIFQKILRYMETAEF